MAINTNNIYALTGSKEVADVYMDSIRESGAGRSGHFGAMKAKLSRKNAFSLLGTKEQKKPQDMYISRADGVTITIPSDWFTATGKVKKGRRLEYKALLQIEE